MTDPFRASPSRVDGPSPSARDGESAPIPDAVVEQAIAWYVRLASGTAPARAETEFACWHDAHPDHVRAWARMQNMRHCLHGEQGGPGVSRAQMTPTLLSFFKRRRALKRLAGLGTLGASLWVAEARLPWRRQLAMASSDVRTPVGARRTMVLPDGTRLDLNTATAVDLRLDAHERRVILRAGEILVATHKDVAGRPFVVATRDGDLVPLGTRFTVRSVETPGQDDFTRLLVVDGAVAVRARDASAAERVRVDAGQQVRFTRRTVHAVTPANGALLAWIDGMFAAESMRLDVLLAELSRYRPGWIRCAPEVAPLRITGVWPLDGADPTDRVLDSIARRLPVRVHRFTPYIVTVAAA